MFDIKVDDLNDIELEALYGHNSDRAIAILLGTIIEDRLTKGLKAFMIQKDDAQQTAVQELFKPSGALGNFRVKLQLAYTLGLLYDWVYEDLTIVAKLRNDFAHKTEINDFNNQSVAARVRNLTPYNDIKELYEENPGFERLNIAWDGSTINAFKLCCLFYIVETNDMERVASVIRAR